MFNASAEAVKCEECGMVVPPNSLHGHAADLAAMQRNPIKNVRRKLTLAEKIFRISKEASRTPIERKGVGESSDPDRPLYSYVKIDDVLEVVQPLLRNYKLILTGNVPKDPMTHISKSLATTEVMVEWTLMDLETGGSFIYRVPGAGSDDQGKGVYKAITGSRKYAMVMIFNLKFGDEPELSEKPKVENAPSSKD
jgi:hypothetical protein